MRLRVTLILNLGSRFRELQQGAGQIFESKHNKKVSLAIYYVPRKCGPANNRAIIFMLKNSFWSFRATGGSTGGSWV